MKNISDWLAKISFHANPLDQEFVCKKAKIIRRYFLDNLERLEHREHIDPDLEKILPEYTQRSNGVPTAFGPQMQNLMNEVSALVYRGTPVKVRKIVGMDNVLELENTVVLIDYKGHTAHSSSVTKLGMHKKFRDAADIVLSENKVPICIYAPRYSQKTFGSNNIFSLSRHDLGILISGTTDFWNVGLGGCDLSLGQDLMSIMVDF